MTLVRVAGDDVPQFEPRLMASLVAIGVEDEHDHTVDDDEDGEDVLGC